MTICFRRVLAVCVLAGAALVATGASADEPPPLPPPPLPPTSAQATSGDLPSAPPPATDAASPARASTGFSYGLPPPEPLGEPRTRRRSTGLMVAGIVLSGLGAVSAIYGGAVLASDGNQCLPFTGTRACDATDPETAGVVMMVAGGALIATGIPLLILGSREVEVEPQPAPPPVAELLVGPTSGALRVRF